MHMKRREGQRGQTLPLVAAALLVLMGAAAFAVDIGYSQYRQRLQQTATDSAALAAGYELLNGNFVAAGKQDASTNGYTDASVNGACVATATCVQVLNPPVAPDAYAGNTDSVEVIITSPNPTFFARAFGISQGTIGTKAVATLITQTSNDCIVTLSGAANFNAGQSGGTLNAPNCGLMFNGGANFNGATVNAASVRCAVACPGTGSSEFTNAQPVLSAPSSDPCPSISYCAYLAKNPPTCDQTPGITIPKTGPVLMTPGCYNSTNMANLSNQNVQFGCGLYIIQTTLDISSTGNKPPVNITQNCSPPGGVTFYIDTGGQVSFRNANIALNAPTTGNYSQDSAGEQNVLFYQVPGNTNTLLLQSASCSTCASNVSGMMYVPDANLNYNASTNTQSGSGVLIIAGSANFNGNLTNIFGATGSGQTQVKIAVLGE